jgi:hypothetical protein
MRPWRELLVCALLMSSGIGDAAETPDCEMRAIASIDIEVDQRGGILVPVQVNGRDAWMALRLSAGLPTIFPASVGYLGLKTEAVRDMKFMVENVRVDRKVTVEHILIGNADFKDWEMYVLPDLGNAGAGPPLYRGKPVIGNLASRFMQVVDVELNVGAKKMNLFNSTRCRGNAVYWGGEFTAVPIYSDRSGLMAFPMELDGKAVETSFATGTRYSILDSFMTKKYFQFDEKSEGNTREPLPGGREAVVRTMALSAKGLAVNSAKVQLVQGKGKECGLGSTKRSKTGSRVNEERDSGSIGYTNCFNITPFAIGTDLLGKLRIYIASREGTIYFTRAESPAAN